MYFNICNGDGVAFPTLQLLPATVCGRINDGCSSRSGCIAPLASWLVHSLNAFTSDYAVFPPWCSEMHAYVV